MSIKNLTTSNADTSIFYWMVDLPKGAALPKGMLLPGLRVKLGYGELGGWQVCIERRTAGAYWIMARAWPAYQSANDGLEGAKTAYAEAEAQLVELLAAGMVNQ